MKQALASSDVVVLVFTSDARTGRTACGSAGSPPIRRTSDRTKVVVLQCGDTSPKPYVDHVRVDLRSLDSVTGFVKTMPHRTDFFSSGSR